MNEVSNAILLLREEHRFFHLFNPDELAVLFPLFGLVGYPPRTEVFAEGEPTMVPLFVVLSGSLEISKKMDFGRPFVLAKLTRGALMGHDSLFRGARIAPVSATSREETVLLMMSADKVSSLLEKHPVIGTKVLKEIIRVQNIRMLELVDRMTSSL